MNRRVFIRSAGLAGASILARRLVRADEHKAARKFILSAPLTHSDWMLKPGMPWGAEGVQKMLDACKQCGWSRIYWRVLDGGRSLYRSKLLDPMGRWDPDSFWSPQSESDKALARRFTAGMTDERRQALLEKFNQFDYAHFDPFAEAIRYGHELGLQIHAWVSINEDDHGWGLRSRFSKAHPGYRWRRRNGSFYHSQLSFAFPEVRQYKLALLHELLTQYDLDGLFLDWIRTGDVRDNPQNDSAGAADYGYELPLTRTYRKDHRTEPESVPNSDETWVRCRTVPSTEFMREVHQLVRNQKKTVPIAALVGHPWHYRGELDRIDGNLRGLLLDVNAWSREGLVDAVVPAGYYRDGGNAEMAWRALAKETEQKPEVWSYAWVPQNLQELAQTFSVAEQVGAKHILFWEADYIADRANATELKQAMAARAQ